MYSFLKNMKWASPRVTAGHKRATAHGGPLRLDMKSCLLCPGERLRSYRIFQRLNKTISMARSAALGLGMVQTNHCSDRTRFSNIPRAAIGSDSILSLGQLSKRIQQHLFVAQVVFEEHQSLPTPLSESGLFPISGQEISERSLDNKLLPMESLCDGVGACSCQLQGLP